MINEEDARRLASAYLEHLSHKPNISGRRTVKSIIVATEAKSYGWVFLVRAVAIEPNTDQKSVTFGGPGTLVVLKSDGSVHVLGTARPPELLLAEFEAHLDDGQYPRLAGK